MRPVPPDAPELEGVALLDVRDESAFAAGHAAGSGHVPHADLKTRRTELPPRETPVIALSDDPREAEGAAAELEALGYSDARWLDAPLAALPGGHGDRGPAARLWRPAPFLEELLPSLPRGRAIDVAAGSGRNAVFLALHGYVAEAWDHDDGALERAAALARRHGVAIEPVVADLERRRPPLPADAYDLVVVFRFLHRPLFPDLERALRPGGALVYETYRDGQERYGRPKQRRFLLRAGELSSAFPGLSVERYEEPEPEGGPITARLLARKP
jgi:tellurite methyltransferase